VIRTDRHCQILLHSTYDAAALWNTAMYMMTNLYTWQNKKGFLNWYIHYDLNRLLYISL